MKFCGSCQEEKPFGLFGKNRSTKDGFQAYCRVCRADIQRLSPEKQKLRTKRYKEKNREKVLERARVYAAHRREKNKDHVYEMNRRSALKQNYGITVEQFEEMSKAQGGVCKICSQVHTHSPKKHLYIDHCHKTGKVRDLLCARCNSAIGQVMENVETLQKMILYLQRHSS